VAKIDPAPFLVRVRQAEANVADARARIAKSRADLALKRLTLERTRELAGRKLIAQNDYDTAKSQHDQAVAQIALDEAALAQAEAALEEARINLGYTDIVSPVDGVVVSRNVDVGQTVAASFQTPTLFEIAEDLTRMQVNTSVSESDIGGVHEGQPARFGVDAYPGRTFEGAVTQVRNAPTVVQNVVTYDVVIAVANPSLELKPGMTASVTITTAERTQALRLPVRALRFHPELAAGESPPPGGEAAPGVWIVEDGELRRVEVSTGLRNDRHAELLDGSLAEGARVVVAMRRTQETRTPPTSPFQPGRRR
jgi:HlyD family secretion protein